VTTVLWLEQPMDPISILSRRKNFTSSSNRAWLVGLIGRGVKLVILHLVPKLRLRASGSQLSHMP